MVRLTWCITKSFYYQFVHDHIDRLKVNKSIDTSKYIKTLIEHTTL